MENLFIELLKNPTRIFSFYITTVKPEGQTIDAMMDRTFGRPSQSVEVKGDITLKLDI